MDDFVAESEHDGVFSLHPLLDVAVARVCRGIGIYLHLGVGVEIISEMLQKGHFFLELAFRRVVAEFVWSDSISLVSYFFLNVFKILSIFINYDLGRVVKIDSC